MNIALRGWLAIVLTLACAACRDDDPRSPDVFVDWDMRARLPDVVSDASSDALADVAADLFEAEVADVADGAIDAVDVAPDAQDATADGPDADDASPDVVPDGASEDAAVDAVDAGPDDAG